MIDIFLEVVITLYIISWILSRLDNG